MRCAICRTGETRPGVADEVLSHEGTTVVIKGVPAEVCDNCGEPYFDADVTRELLALVREAAAAGVVVEVRRYAA